MKPTHKILLALVFLLAGTLIVLLSAQEVSAETITVDDDGPANYSKIQDAIDNGVEGDTLSTIRFYREDIATRWG